MMTETCPELVHRESDDPDDDSVTVRNWQNVTALRLHLLSREIDPSPGYKDEKTYTLGLECCW